DAARASGFERQTHAILVGACVARGNGLDVIVVRLLAAEVEAEKIPDLHQAIVGPHALGVESGPLLLLPGLIVGDQRLDLRAERRQVVASRRVLDAPVAPLPETGAVHADDEP